MAGLSSDEVSLTEMIAYVMNKHRSGCLTVRRYTPAGVSDVQLYFAGGHLADARLDDEAGDDIIYRTLGLREHLDYGWQTDVEAPGQSISRADEFFLMAALGIDPGIVFDSESAAAKRAAAALRDETPPPPPEVAPLTDERTPAEQLAAQPDQVAAAHLHFSRRNSLPLPNGQPIPLDEALSQSPRNLLSLDEQADLGVLLDGLSKGLFSGYLCWERKGSRGTMLFYRGQLIDALWSEVATRFGGTTPTSDAPASSEAYRRIAADAEREPIRSYASLYQLEDTFIYAYSSLAYGESLLGSRSSRDVSLPNLLASLARNRHTGCVRLTLEQRGEVGGEIPSAVSAYIFLDEGRELGRYLDEDGTLVSDATAALALARNQHTLIDIYTAPPREQFDVLTVPADAPDPGELFAQRDRRLADAGFALTPTPPANATPRPLATVPPAPSPPPRHRRPAPPTRQIDAREAMSSTDLPLAEPVEPIAPPQPPAISRISDSGRLTTNSGRLSGGPANPADLAASLQQVSREVLGSKAGRVVDILQEIESKPQDLARIITQARRATKMLIGIGEYEELSGKFDALLAAFKLNQSP